MHHALEERKRHIRIGRYLKDIVFGANDGVVTTFAVVAGTVGANLSPVVILIIGIANLVADGFSMATGNYLGTKSEINFYHKEEVSERQEVATVPEEEKQEVRDLLAAKGYGGEDLDRLTALIVSNERFWIDFMMHEELGLLKPDDASPLKNAFATFVAFTVAGAIPLIPYVFGVHASFMSSAILAALTLFAVGALRTFFSNHSWVLSGLEMLAVGGFAAFLAYAVGFTLKYIFGL